MTTARSRTERPGGANIRAAVRRSLPAVAGTLSVGAVLAPAFAAQLPVPCLVNNCGANGPTTFVTSGQARAVQVGNSLTVTQTTPNAVLNWSSFNISSDGKVTFAQPSSASVALNEIFQSDPSKILGALGANGTIYLINQNGILFGSGAKVNVGSLVASSLNLSPSAAQGGILQAGVDGQPAFVTAVDAQGNPVSGPVQVASGASLQTAAGGQIMLFAPQITNSGSIRADGGQVILAAGDQVYLAPSNDPNLRGLLVEVGQGGTVTNSAASAPGAANGGQIASNNGDVTLTGLIVNQLGRVSATTTVRENGSIRLLAQSGGGIVGGPSGGTLQPVTGGTLNLGPGSRTDVTLDTSDAGTAVDATAQPHSLVDLRGATVTLHSGSEITATSGNVSIVALQSEQQDSGTVVPDTSTISAQPSSSRLIIESGASIDVSGAQIQLPVASSVIPVQLRGTELADSPVQRNGPLRGQTVYIDVRQSGVLPDGTAWQGTPIGDVSGYIAAMERGVAQRNLTGGSITLASDGAVFVDPKAQLNLSGGAIQYQSGFVNTTQVLGTNGQVYDISQASPTQTYSGIVNAATFTDPKWGVTETFTGNYGSSFGRYQQGYVQGADAGSLTVNAPRLVLDGNVVANTEVGPYQRNPPGAIPTGALYRPINQVPLGAQLIVGGTGAFGVAGETDHILENVTFAGGSVFDTLSGPNGGAFNPLTDPLPDSLSTTVLHPDLFGEDRFTGLTILANGTVSIPQGLNLDLPGGASLSITAGAIDAQGTVRIPGGAITLAAGGTIDALSGLAPLITLGPSASLNVSGEWVNDLPPGASLPGTAELAIQGGTVALNPTGAATLQLKPGSSIDVSGGAWRQPSGTIVSGAAGSIQILTGVPTAATGAPKLAGTLRAFGATSGGSLSLTTDSICVSAADCRGGNPDEQWLTPALFTADGFANISLTALAGTLNVTAGTTIVAQQRNLQFLEDPSAAASADSLRSLTEPVLLPDYLRAPVNVSLSYRATAAGGVPFLASTFDSAGQLEIGAGASIRLDPLGTLSMTSNTSIFIDGTLTAPGGRIAATLTNSLLTGEVIPDQGIWLSSDAHLSTAGVPVTQTNDLGQTVGQVLGGGSVALTADRGYVITAPGSSIDVSGSAATLTLNDVAGTVGPTRTALVGSSGGQVTLQAAEGLWLGGGLSAFGGNAPGTAGGTLDLSLNPDLRGAEPASGAPIFSLGPRTIEIMAPPGPSPAAGSAIPLQSDGFAYVPGTVLKSSGFNSIELSALNVFDALGQFQGQKPESIGSIVFPGSFALAVPGGLRLQAEQIVLADGANVSLSGTYVGLGYDVSEAALSAPPVSTGTGELRVAGNLIDLIGYLGISGTASTTLASTGDVRFIGVETGFGSSASLTGALAVQGNLELHAAQAYPTTLTSYVIGVPGAQPGTLEISGLGSLPETPLSAGGSLTLSAGTIEQDGVLRAPFGDLTLQGSNVILGSGSITSTSGAGMTIPFGSTQAGSDWTYNIAPGQTTIYTQSGPPSKSITLQGQSLIVAKGAAVDVSGGGDLQAYEFEPGVGGTHDVLSSTYSSTEFAIIPTLGSHFAPYDPQMQTGFAYAPGSTVVLAGGGGVPAGTYTVLPAYYALMPGAYLVQPVSGYTDLAPGQVINSSDGSSIVAGQFGQYGTSVLQSRSQGFDIRQGSAVQQLAQYNLTSANSFFSTLAATTNSSPPLLPRDAGQLTLAAGQQLQFLGTLLATPAPQGRGGSVDISATELELVNGDGPAQQAGAVALNASQLDSLGAGSLLIGGTRTLGNGAVQLQTTSSSVFVDPGVTLTGNDLLLAARDTLDIGSGAVITATGTSTAAPTEYDVSGGGALVRVSTGANAPIVRTSLDSSLGNLSLGAGSVLRAAGGSVALDASGNLESQATYALPGGSLAFDAPRVSLGAAPSGTSGLVLATGPLSALGLSDLSITSPSAIDIYGTNTLSLTGSLHLNAPVLEAATADAAAVFQARSIVLQGSPDPAGGSPVTSTGALVLSGNQTTLAGNTALLGFSRVELDATSGLIANGSGSLTTSAPLTLRTGTLSTGNAASFEISASGALQIEDPASAQGAAPKPGVGGALTLQGSSVLIDTRVTLPSGVLAVQANGGAPTDGVTIGSDGILDVSGLRTVFDSVESDGPGGRITLSSAAGGVDVSAGARLNLASGGGAAAAGTLLVTAPQGEVTLDGTLAASGSTAALGGQIVVDAAQLPDLGQLDAALNAGGFTNLRAFEQFGPGNITLAAGAAPMKASNVSLVVDQGALAVLGSIDASGPSGGSVSLSARDGVDIEGSVQANALTAGGSGGSVLLSSTGGSITLGADSLVNVGGGSAAAAGGTLAFRVPRSTLTDLLSATPSGPTLQLGGRVVGAASVDVEGVAVYSAGDGIITPDGVISAANVAATSANPIYADASAFMASAPAIAAALSPGGGLPITVTPGIEIQSTGDLTLGADWNLASWSFGAPGTLSLRAAGNLTFLHSLSDGFQSTTGTGEFSLLAQPSWSYQLVAGANLQSQNVLSVVSPAELTPGSGSLQIAAGVPDLGSRPPQPIMIRTGTGNIDIAAAGDLDFGNQASVIYTAGMASGLGVPLRALSNLPYPVDGGNISVNVGGDIIGAPTNQLVTSWLWRSGTPGAAGAASGWTDNYQWFEENVGALAGGNVHVTAGGNIQDLSVAVANIGRQTGGASSAQSQVVVTGGGQLSVTSGGDINGGSYFVGSGTGSLVSWGSVGAGTTGPAVGTGLSPVIALGDAQVSVQSRTDLELQSILNPFLLPVSNAQGPLFADFFTTYTDASAVNLYSAGGNVNLLNPQNSGAGLQQQLSSMTFGSVSATYAFSLLPGTVTVAAPVGGIDLVGGELALWPSHSGNLELFAAQNIDFSASGGLMMSDVDPATLPTVASPLRSLGLLGPTLFEAPAPGTAHTPIHSGVDGTAEDTTPARIVSLNGDIAEASLLYIPKPIDIVAGRDILDLSLDDEQYAASNVSVIEAGGNISYSFPRNPITGGLLQQSGIGVVLEGPGQLLVEAGGNVNLGTSPGITSAGNFSNPALPSTGADVSVMAGATTAKADLAGFINTYLVSGTAYDSLLMSFVQQETGQAPSGKASALRLFSALSPNEQLLLCQQILFAELDAGGRSAAAPGAAHDDYARSFEALSALFPGASDPSKAATDYPGSISLYFSRIYTLSGGSVSLLAPGGGVNAGIANPPTAFGLSKSPSDLGVVDQGTGDVSALVFGDFQVNESRVFAADGGNILVWSTFGNIDAGRGAKTAISAPPPLVELDANGHLVTVFPAALQGSGIQALATTTGVSPGNVDLFAPHGVVNAGDAGIVAGNLTIGATAVLGRDNITVSGTAVGIPVEVTGLGASLAGSSAAGSSASSAAAESVGPKTSDTSTASASQAAMSWLDVFIEGFGEEVCKSSDVECLKRQHKSN